MAFAVLFSLAETTYQIQDHYEYPLSDNGKQQIHRLLEKILPMGKNFDMYQEEGSMLERRIRDAANEAEDVIEHLMHEHIRSTAAGLATDIQYDLGELNMVIDEINSIAEEVDELIQQNRVKLPTATPAVDRMLQSSPTPTPAVDGFPVGLEEHVDKLRVLLIQYQEDFVKRIIPITGMGGIGKTTLARAVFEDEKVVNYFPVRAWITVSKNYETQNVYEELLFSLEKQVEKGLVNDCDTMVRKLRQILMKNKYLIVLDDLWSYEAWADIRKALLFPLIRKNDGSRILISTRDEGAVPFRGFSTNAHKMDVMDENLSWCLLKQKVFASRECPSDLEKIGKDIAKACKGLPLAIVIAARILSQRVQSQSSWEEVAQNIRSLIVEDEQFKEIMLLSYTDLSYLLRSCFLYMCGFHDHYEIRVSVLVKLLVAEGFVKDEWLAEKNVTEIVSKNLASSTAIKCNGNIKSCSVHDLVRDLYKIKAIDENYERRISNSHLDLREVARAYASTMRSVISFQPSESSLRGLRKFKLLRVLDVVDTDAYSLPASVFDLFHLRYLAFGCPMEVPSAISRLRYLQYLIIRPSKRSRKYRYSCQIQNPEYSKYDVYLPLEIWMMPLLTHLVSFFDLLPNPEGAASSSALKKLLTLCVVKKLICTEEMMKLICNVEKLSITYFGDRCQQDYQLHNLALLRQLEKLTLVVMEGSLLQRKAKPIFPQTLIKLTLSGWRFPWEDMKAIAALPNLQVLKLRDHAFQGHTWNTIEESDEVDDEEDDEVLLFVKLEYLLIEESDLERWITDNRHFPALKRLVLNSCGKLSEIPNAIGYKYDLELVEVDRANLSLLKCVREIQKERTNKKFRDLEVREL